MTTLSCGHKANRTTRKYCETCRQIEERRKASESQPLKPEYVTPQYRQWWRDVLEEVRRNSLNLPN